nr:MAG TPA: putative integral membrane protein [Caudoviricetes sp.]
MKINIEKFGRVFQLSFGVVFIFVLFSCAVRGYFSYGLTWQIAVIAAAALGTLWAARKGYLLLDGRLTERRADAVFFVLAVLMLAAQLYCGYRLSFAPITDLGYTDRAARAFCVDWDVSAISDSLPARHKNYFAIYPNNQALLILLALLYKAQYLLTGSMTRAVPIFVNVVALNCSYVFMYKNAKLIFKGSASKPLFAAVCGFFFSVFYTYTPFYYTDSLSMPFVMLALYAYLRGAESVNAKKYPSAVLQLSLCALCVAVGFKIKGSVVVLLVALSIYSAIRRWECKRQWAVRTAVAVGTAAAALIFIKLLSVGISAFNIASDADYERYKFPIQHWIMMGMRSRGGYSYRDFAYTLSFETYEEKAAAAVTRIAYRFENFGLGGLTLHFFKKAAYTWTDGSYLIFYHIDGGENSLLRKFITDTSAFRYICEVYHIAMLFAITGGFLKAYDDKKTKVNDVWLLRIIFVGVFFFFELWETRSRYLVNFTPVFLLLMTEFITRNNAVHSNKIHFLKGESSCQ